MSNSKRLGLIDFIKGITLISMILYHACWDLQYMFGVNVWGYTSLPGVIWQKSICITFIFVSGFLIHFGRDVNKKVKRGLIISGCGLLITFITVVIMPENSIYYGILTFTGFAMILYGILGKSLQKIGGIPGLIISVFLYVVFSRVNYGIAGVGKYTIQLPNSIYRNQFTTFLGFPFPGFRSEDYFSLFPWIFIYHAGFSFGQVAKKYGLTKVMYKPTKSPVNFLGKHTLIFYMVHQPVIYGVLLLVFKIIP